MSDYALPLTSRRQGQALSGAIALVSRALRLSLRNTESLITVAALPALLLLMFVYLFGGAITTGVRYVNYVVPGVMLVCVGFGAASTAVSVASDLNGAIIDRFRAMDVRIESLVNGHVVASVMRNLMSTVIVFAVAFAIGFRSNAGVGHWLAAIAVLTIYVLALSWLAAAIGIAAKSPEGATGVTFLISFLPYASSAFVPVRTMPHWLWGYANNQPVTAVANSMRALLLGEPVGSNVWHAVVWSVGILMVSVALSRLLFRRRTR